MGSQEEATKAVTMFNGKELDGRALTVNEARPREDRPRGDFGGGGGGGGGGGVAADAVSSAAAAAAVVAVGATKPTTHLSY